MILVFTVSIVTNNSLEIDYSQGHYIQISSIMHGMHFLPFTIVRQGNGGKNAEGWRSA